MKLEKGDIGMQRKRRDGVPKKVIVSEADAVHGAAGRTPITDTGKVMEARRDLRPCQDVKRSKI
jgi:hypothetical protein